jgi:RNA polymerase sigma-70 factor (ECF subfamily)
VQESTSTCLQRALAGDEAARGELLDRHVARLRAYVRRRQGARLAARESSRDVVQSVLREALAGLDGFRAGEPPARSGFWRWLARTAENKLASRGRFWSRLRRDDAREQPAEGAAADDLFGTDGASPSQAAMAREELERLERAFAELPPAWREVIVLVRLSGLSHAEAARRLGRTEASTRTLLSRALARLATRLEDGSGPPGPGPA